MRSQRCLVSGIRAPLLGVAALIVITAWTGETQAETGTLRMRFVYGGPMAPKLDDIEPNRDVAFCGKHDIPDESLLVDPDTKAIANVILYVYTGRGGSDLPAMEPGNKNHILANDKCRFDPHIVIAQVGDTLEVTNPDDVGHNANISFFKNTPQNPNIPPNGSVKFELAEPEPAPIPVQCNIHPWMLAKLVVLDHPFGAVSGPDGVIEIEGLPVGELNFRVNHESAKIDDVIVEGKEESWRRSRVDIDIKAGMNDLGDVVIPADAFDVN
ncbi:MAG: methylamine utilization protein [Planctomycetota bacterium]